VQARKWLVVIVEDIDGEGMVRVLRTSPVCSCRSRTLGIGDNRQSILGDLVILTGGPVFADDLNTKLEGATRTPVYSVYPA
jgi:chaperonin GroEL (HSP60 family)